MKSEPVGSGDKIMIKLKKNDFIKWLKDKDPSTTVGKSSSATHCPIANYLKGLGARKVIVECYNYTFVSKKDCVCVDMPAWANKFVAYVDLVDANITAFVALKALK